MKKLWVFFAIYFIFLSIPVYEDIKADGSVIKYKLYMDSNSDNMLQVKEEVTDILAYLCDNVTEDSYATMIHANLSLFKKIDKSNVKFKNAVLTIKIGDGKGSYINGEYEKDAVCLERVKPKSKIMEWLGMD